MRSMSDVTDAASILRAGGLVAFPTETVYGLGADATNVAAVEKIFRAKGRPSTNPLIVHVADESVARRYAADWPETATTLARHFWPGPLTLVLPKRSSIVDLVTAGRGTVGLRAPNHPLTLRLLQQFDGPLAGPSANRSNHLSPTTAQHVRDDLGNAFDLILDGGPCEIGIESTVLDLTTNPPTILRPGGTSRDQIEQQIGPIQILSGSVLAETAAVSPGQHALHYAPKAAAFRFEAEQAKEIIRQYANQKEPVAIVLLSPVTSPSPKVKSMSTDPVEYARTLYSTLREFDYQKVETIYIEMPPNSPAWAAVRDRIKRATQCLSASRR